MSPPTKLSAAAALFSEREQLYGANYERVGAALSTFFPNGVRLRSPQDFTRYHVLTTMVAKLGRYMFNWSSGHPDSIEDLIVYAAILAALDETGNQHESDSPDRVIP
jgi:hypothetical protein